MVAPLEEHDGLRALALLLAPSAACPACDNCGERLKAISCIVFSSPTQVATRATDARSLEVVININFSLIATSTVLIATFVTCTPVLAQSQLPAPSRTIYKCVVKGTVSYSDEPCAGAQRLDATPVSGVDRLSGSTRTGKDVAQEIHSQQFAVALRPLSGMTAAQFATASRRTVLDPAAQRECSQLEPAILGLERAETHADAAALKPIQQDLFTLRKRYKTLVC